MDKVERDRLRGDQTEPVQGPTLTEKAIQLDDAGFKLATVRKKCRVSQKRRALFHYEGSCKNCEEIVKTPSHVKHQVSTDLAYNDTCPHCGVAIVGVETVGTVPIAAQTDASFATA